MKKHKNSFNKSLTNSNSTHYDLMDKWHKKGNSNKNRAYGNYHADCIDQQNSRNRILTKTERNKLFSWWWNYEVNDKHDKYPL